MKTVTKKLVLAFLAGVRTTVLVGEGYWEYYKLSMKVDYVFGYVQVLDQMMRSAR